MHRFGPNRSSEPTQVTLLAVINTLVLIIAALSVSHAVMGSSLNASILAKSQATSTRRQRESRDGKACHHAPTGTIKQRCLARLACIRHANSIQCHLSHHLFRTVHSSLTQVQHGLQCVDNAVAVCKWNHVRLIFLKSLLIRASWCAPPHMHSSARLQSFASTYRVNRRKSHGPTLQRLVHR